MFLLSDDAKNNNNNMENREKMNMRAPADQEAGTLRADIIITFNTNTRLPQPRLSQRHIAWDTCALP